MLEKKMSLEERAENLVAFARNTKENELDNVIKAVVNFAREERIKVLKELDSIGYNGNFILQTARAVDENHTTILSQYRDQVVKWME